MRHVSVISGHPISIGFHGLTGSQRDPQVGASQNHFTKIVLLACQYDHKDPLELEQFLLVREIYLIFQPSNLAPRLSRIFW